MNTDEPGPEIPEPYGFAEEWAVDGYLSNVESLLIAISQRPMTEDQRHRLLLLLERAYADERRRPRRRKRR